MKRTISCIVLLAMIMSMCIPALAIDLQTEEVKTVDKVIDVEVGKEQSATFVCSALQSVITLKNGDKEVAKMYDNGRNGDAKKNDGIASANITLSSDERKTETYYAYANGVEVAKYTVNYYNELTEADFAVKDAVNANVYQIEKQCMDKNAAYDAVLTYLEGCEDIVSIECAQNSISYTTEAGITSVYARLDGDTKGTASVNAANAAIEIKADSEMSSWTNPNVLVLRPFRHGTTENAAGFQEDCYTQAAGRIVEKTGGKVLLFDDEEANVYNFGANLDKVGFFFMDSHGLDIKNGDTMLSTIIMKNVNNDGITSADWSAGRVFDMYYEDLVAVSGEYIRAHYSEENRRLENTMCYLGICLGMKYDSLKVPLADMGARLVMGYTETVSTYYDNNMLLEITNNVLKMKDQAHSWTYADAIAAAKNKFGQVDPAGWGAVLETYGNDQLVIIYPQTTVTEIKTDADEYTAIVNQKCFIFTDIRSDATEAHGYTQEWSTSDSEIAKVFGPRIIQGVKDGEVTITCKIKGKNTSAEHSWKVNVVTVQPTSILLAPERTQLQAGSDVNVMCVVYPRNASFRDYVLHSTNEGSVKVNGNKIVALTPGNTDLWVEVPGTDLVAVKKVSVNSKKMYMSSEVIDAENTYALAVMQGTVAQLMTGAKSGSNMTPVQVPCANGFLNAADVKGNRVWQLIPANGGFYIYNVADEKYLSINSNSDIIFSTSKDTLFEREGMKIKVKGSEESKIYIRYRGDKNFFCYGTKGNASEVSLCRLMDYSNEALFKTVDFETETLRYSQTVETGSRAVPVQPIPVKGKVFLGWDKPLAAINENITVNAMYRDGESEAGKVLVTFLYTDGTVIETREFATGEKITAPTPDKERGGIAFSGWSEELGKAQYNMTVFALYENNALLGDVNADGDINTADAVMILRKAADLVTLDESQNKAADVTHDGEVNTADAVLILKYSAGLIAQF